MDAGYDHPHKKGDEQDKEQQEHHGKQRVHQAEHVSPPFLNKKRPSSPQQGTKGKTFRGTTRIRAKIKTTRTLNPVTEVNRPALADRSQANQRTPNKAVFSRRPPLSGVGKLLIFLFFAFH